MALMRWVVLFGAWVGAGGAGVHAATVTPSPPVAAPTLTPEEQAVRPPDWSADPPPGNTDSAAPRIVIDAETVYFDAEGHPTVDLLEQDYAYLTIQVRSASGAPVAGVKPQLTITGNSRVQSLAESTAGQRTDAMGFFEVAVVGGRMGRDLLRVEALGAHAALRINVISLEAAGFPDPASVEGAISWSQLTRATTRWDEDDRLQVKFPQDVAALNGTSVRVAGFMMPLQPEARQRHFLLTAFPPSCFFHIPGGPAGAVEVHAAKGVDVNWDLLVLEGRFETVQHSEMGVVYRLHVGE